MANRILPFPPAAATADPATSHEAAERVTERGDRLANSQAVLDLLLGHPGSTSYELYAAQADLDRHEISRRLSDLRNANVIRQGDKRRCRIKGTNMVTWWPVSQQGKLF